MEKFVDFHYSELVLDKIDEIDVSLFKNLEIKKYDLIYEDRYDAHIRQTVCGDILLLIKKTNYVPSIIFDGHWKSVFFHKKKFKSLYNISISGQIEDAIDDGGDGDGVISLIINKK